MFILPEGHKDKCHISTNMEGNLTFGRGELDAWGYWQYPCTVCARAWQKQFPEEEPK
jgi:hypothetical protein